MPSQPALSSSQHRQDDEDDAVLEIMLQEAERLAAQIQSLREHQQQHGISGTGAATPQMIMMMAQQQQQQPAVIPNTIDLRDGADTVASSVGNGYAPGGELMPIRWMPALLEDYDDNDNEHVISATGRAQLDDDEDEEESEEEEESTGSQEEGGTEEEESEEEDVEEIVFGNDEDDESTLFRIKSKPKPPPLPPRMSNPRSRSTTTTGSSVDADGGSRIRGLAAATKYVAHVNKNNPNSGVRLVCPSPSNSVHSKSSDHYSGFPRSHSNNHHYSSKQVWGNEGKRVVVVSKEEQFAGIEATDSHSVYHDASPVLPKKTVRHLDQVANASVVSDDDDNDKYKRNRGHHHASNNNNKPRKATTTKVKKSTCGSTGSSKNQASLSLPKQAQSPSSKSRASVQAAERAAQAMARALREMERRSSTEEEDGEDDDEDSTGSSPPPPLAVLPSRAASAKSCGSSSTHTKTAKTSKYNTKNKVNKKKKSSTHGNQALDWQQQGTHYSKLDDDVVSIADYCNLNKQTKSTATSSNTGSIELKKAAKTIKDKQPPTSPVPKTWTPTKPIQTKDGAGGVRTPKSGVKWEKVDTATVGDDDYVPLRDYSQPECGSTSQDDDDEDEVVEAQDKLFLSVPGLQSSSSSSSTLDCVATTTGTNSGNINTVITAHRAAILKRRKVRRRKRVRRCLFALLVTLLCLALYYKKFLYELKETMMASSSSEEVVVVETANFTAVEVPLLENRQQIVPANSIEFHFAALDSTSIACMEYYNFDKESGCQPIPVECSSWDNRTEDAGQITDALTVANVGDGLIASQSSDNKRNAAINVNALTTPGPTNLVTAICHLPFANLLIPICRARRLRELQMMKKAKQERKEASYGPDGDERGGRMTRERVESLVQSIMQ